MKIASIKKVGPNPVYDLSLDATEYDEQHYILKNGVVTHNTGIYYSANQIFIITKAQEKDGTDLAGWKFTINIEKSRYVKEKAKLPFTVLYESGIQKWSSLFDLALEFGYILKAKVGWYQTVDPETGEVSEKNLRLAEIQKDDVFFEKLIRNDEFKKKVEFVYKLSAKTKKEDVLEDEVYDEDDDGLDISE